MTARQSTQPNPETETEAALAVIRAEETNPHRPDWAPVPNHGAVDLLAALQRAVDAARAARKIDGAA